MKLNRFIMIFVSVLLIAGCQNTTKEPVDYVNHFSGTHSSRWMLFPGSSMPFGMVKLSPDNTDEWTMDAGYEYDIESIAGFGHVHSWMMGSFLCMPITGSVKIAPGTKDDPDAGYRSRFSHDNEHASPGYYSVILDDYNIKAELTTTTRAGFQRYTFPKTDSAKIIFDLQVPEEGQPVIINAMIKKISDTEIAGTIYRIGGWNEYKLHFVARFNREFESMNAWTGEEIVHDIEESSVSGNIDIGAFVNFSTQNDQVVLMKTGISYVSIDQARKNMDIEMDEFGWDFDAVHENARAIWAKLLNKIKVEGGSEDDKIKFYTNLYRSYSARTIFSDADGKYMDMCENIQQLDDPESPVYGCDAFWNTFWNLNQLWSLVNPDIAEKWVNSLLEIYDKGGWLPKGPGGIEYSSVMVASHEIPLIVNAWQKGLRNFDVEKAYQAMKEIQTTAGKSHECGGHVGNGNLISYMEKGFVPSEEGPVSNTLEYAYDDWCVAQLAKSLGKEDDYIYFMNRSQNYRNVFDKESGYMRPKESGGPWYQEFEAVVKAIGKEDNFGGKDYVEGNAWQYSWYVPHDLPGLIDLMEKEEFNKRLDEGFENSKPNFVSQFVNHSNQPNMQAAWLFNYSGKPWLTQKWVREILNNYYGTGPYDGYPGDEDQGQMGSWYVMSAMGLFEMDGGVSVNPVYEIASPIFEKVIIQLDENYYDGSEFIIEAKNVSSENKYIQSATLNGEVLDSYWFYHSELVKGGSLVLEMGPEPNKNWASDVQAPNNYNIDAIVTSPYISTASKLFLDESLVSMKCDTEGAEIYFTMDGKNPDKSARMYVDPFTINRTTTIKMIAYKDDKSSLPATAILKKAIYYQAKEVGSVKPGIDYSYYSGIFHRVSEIEETEPVKAGVISTFSIEPKESETFFGFDFKAYIQIPKDGLYTFYLKTNDGGKMFLADEVIINNDGLHPAIERTKTLALRKGFYPVQVKYFQEGGSNMLKLSWKGPGIEKQEIPASVLFHK